MKNVLFASIFIFLIIYVYIPQQTKQQKVSLEAIPISVTTPTLAPIALPVPPMKQYGVVRVMPLGDSITHGDRVLGGYRTKLWRRFADDGSRINIVGSKSDGTDDLGDQDHEGHIGFTIKTIAEKTQGWMKIDQPDIILLHIGTNDILKGLSSESMTKNLSVLLDEIYAAKPDTYIIISTLIPMYGKTKIHEEKRLEYNTFIYSIVNAHRSKGHKIVWVDMSNALTEEDYLDGVHPNYDGFNKMAEKWYPVVTSIYNEYPY